MNSQIDLLLSLNDDERAELLASFRPEELNALSWAWRLWARPNQIAPDGDWRTWLVLAGRGFGKTRTGVEWIREEVESGRARRIAIIGRTAADVRDVIVEGESGFLRTAPPWMMPRYEPSKRRLTWSNGAMAIAYSADEPDSLRGPQHDCFLADELASWKFTETWDNLQLGLRLGRNPRGIVTTTPRPTKLIRELARDPNTHVTRGSTYDNRDNLAPAFLDKILSKYEGTRLGKQEIYAEILDAVVGALWSLDAIEQHRAARVPAELGRVVVAIDPAVTANEGSNETGIVVVGTDRQRKDAYVIDDLSGTYTPHEWAERAVTAYHDHQADAVVAEVNNGGDLVEVNLRTVDRDSAVNYVPVHASRGKMIRAEPVSNLYSRGRVHHVGILPELENQLCNWIPGTKSPDRLDALVWGVTALLLDKEASQAKDARRRLENMTRW